ncbi:hypothetical protein DPMN_165107 [Dreissena polymorpha]|uniref:Uncharacterized protein n=1 Tax=Dreissena polymorpha TaxID=45954 RepID=A0A9D4EX23_DREPO|nr:hypothetical protein DPMN_165107 [Dreissena polymorpha]
MERSLTLDDLRECATHLASSVDELVQFKAILDADQDRTITHISELLKLDSGKLQTTFPNFAMALRIIPDVIFNIITREKLSTEHHESGKVDRIGLLSTECQVLRELDVTQLS